MNKKVWCMCKVAVLLIKPIAFFTFWLSSMSLVLKVPNVKEGGVVVKFLSSGINRHRG